MIKVGLLQRMALQKEKEKNACRSLTYFKGMSEKEGRILTGHGFREIKLAYKPVRKYTQYGRIIRKVDKQHIVVAIVRRCI